MIKVLVLILMSMGFSQKVWQSSYETSRDFTNTANGSPWYVENGNAYASTMDSSMENGVTGVWSHKHWIDSSRGIDNEDPYMPHRAYVTLQFHKLPLAYFRKTLIQLYIWTDITLENRVGIDDWLSIATVSCDSSNNWQRTILINLTTDGYIRLVHVPNQGEQTHTFQVNASNNPSGNKKWKQKKWNRVDMYLDTDSISGKAIVWQNQVKVSSAEVRQCQFSLGLTPYIVQAHFGLYASERLSRGIVYNDKIRFIEVANDSVAQVLVNENW